MYCTVLQCSLLCILGGIQLLFFLVYGLYVLIYAILWSNTLHGLPTGPYFRIVSQIISNFNTPPKAYFTILALGQLHTGWQSTKFALMKQIVTTNRVYHPVCTADMHRPAVGSHIILACSSIPWYHGTDCWRGDIHPGRRYTSGVYPLPVRSSYSWWPC